MDKNIIAPHSLAVGRKESAFFEDLQSNEDVLNDQIRGSKILVIGGAGSIGSNTIGTIANYKPKSLHVVDQNENGLAELVRNLRSRESGFEVDDFRTLPLNYGGRAFELFLKENSPYDYVLNFAALKHVRSEKDPYSILEMLNTNLVLMSGLLSRFKNLGAPKKFFSVSTDKAANPSSVMGATKRLMEHFMFDAQLERPQDMKTTSARFANVAYSNGSLLQSFENRFSLGQPLVAPKDCERYFVSLNESGHICTLASFVAPENTIVIPNLDPRKNLVKLEDALYGFLEFKGYEPELFSSESEARCAVPSSNAKGKWPILLTPLDTAGEKPYEEFVGKDEQELEIGLSELRGVSYKAAKPGAVLKVKQRLSDIMGCDIEDAARLTKAELVELIATVEPEFLRTHKVSESNLDQRM